MRQRTKGEKKYVCRQCDCTLKVGEQSKHEIIFAIRKNASKNVIFYHANESGSTMYAMNATSALNLI